MSDNNTVDEHSQDTPSAENTQAQTNGKQEQETPYADVEGEQLRQMLQERDNEREELQQKLADAEDQRLRKAAELENYRKRVKRERSQIYDTAKANALEDFLSISDDLSRTLSAADDMEVNQEFLQGVTLVANKFDDVLNKHGVERIDDEGVAFNVDLHDALMRQAPDDDSVGSDVVLKVVENGYKIGDRVIRHAKVIVSE